jgi:glycosyltransferase involved in cell wall biosynthesis
LEEPITWTIVITTRNRAAMLKRALDSCLVQSNLCAIVVVDEGSTDNTPAIVKDFPTVKYIRNETPVGHSAAVNLGVKHATTSWIKPLDDDDYLLPNCLETLTQLLTQAKDLGYSPSLVSAYAHNVDEKGNIIGGTRNFPVDTGVVLRSADLLQMMLVDQALLGCPDQVGYHRLSFLRCGGWNEDRPFTDPFGDDVEPLIRLASVGDAVIGKAPVACRTLWSQNSRYSSTEKHKLEIIIYLKRLIQAAIDSTPLNETKCPPDIEAYLAFHFSLVALKQRDVGGAMALALKGLRRPLAARYLVKRARLTDALKRVNRLPKLS